MNKYFILVTTAFILPLNVFAASLDVDNSCSILDFDAITLPQKNEMKLVQYEGAYHQTTEGASINAYFDDSETLRLIELVRYGEMGKSELSANIISDEHIIFDTISYTYSGHIYSLYNEGKEAEITGENHSRYYVCNDRLMPGIQYQNPDEFDGWYSLFERVSAEADILRKYSDLSLAGWNVFDAVKYLTENNIISGYPDGTFRPDNTINRAEFTKIVVGALPPSLTLPPVEEGNSPSSLERGLGGEVDAQNCFPDVPNDVWFASYVCSAKEQGIIGGHPDGTFGPANNINVAEASKIVVEAFDLDISFFERLQDDSMEWYVPYMNVLKDIEALPSSAQDPDHLLTRGEIAEIIFRVMTRVK